jgi:hypothetical protein
LHYFPYKFRWREKDQYVLWFENDSDGVVTERGSVLVFASKEFASDFAFEHDLPYSPSEAEIDLDWLATAQFDQEIDCIRTLAAWNFFADVASSMPEKATDFFALDRRPSELYEKIFWGNNLPAVTPAGEHYAPHLSPAELAEIEVILSAGLDLFTGNLKTAA